MPCATSCSAAWGGHDGAPRAACGISREQVEAVYRQLALTYHPDRGGEHLAMVAVTEMRDRLRQLAG
jgi:hypothetical protein